MKFEWDADKNQTNQKKHGVNFEDAAEIWLGNRIDVEGIAYSKTEERSATLGLIKNKL